MMTRNGIVVVGAAILGVGVLVWTLSQPSQDSVGQAMETGDAGSSTAGVPIVEVTLPDTLSATAEIGKRAFEAKCAACHGANAAGQDGVAPPLVHKIYESGHHGDAAFMLAARNGVRAHHWKFGNMPPVEGITDGEVMMIVAYVRELQQANGID